MNRSLLLVSLTALVGLTGCAFNSDPQSEWTRKTVQLDNVRGLEGCLLVRFNDDTNTERTVVRCPNSSVTTATRLGKHGSRYDTVDDGDLVGPPAPRDCIKVNTALYCKD